MPPIHISFTGKMIASDLTRKWTLWNVNAFCGELMYHPQSAAPIMTFGLSGPNAYILNAKKYTDDDAGTISSYYVTYFFVSHEMEQALQLGSHRKDYLYLTAFVQGIGTVTFTPLLCSLENVQASTQAQVLSMTPNFDLEFDINVTTSRCAFKIAVQPLTGQTDAYFSLQKLILNMKKSKTPVRGTNTGSY